MICPPLTTAPLVINWLERHRNPVSFTLHILGIPPTIIGVLMVPIYVMMLSAPIFLLSAGLFLGGYLIQFLGHALEGTEPGEIAYLRRKIRHFIRKRLGTVEATPGRVA